MTETDSTVDRKVNLLPEEIKKEKPMIGRKIVCSLCGNGDGTLVKDSKGGYVHQQRPCPPKKKED